MNALLQGQGWHIVGWTMVYFLAAGTVVILVGAALRFALRTASPTLRYTTSLTVFAVLALLPIAIVGSLASRVVPDHGPYSASKLAQLPVRVELKATASGTVTEQALLPEVMPFPSAESNLTPPVQTRDEIASLLTGAVEYLPWVWIVGTPLTFLLLASGLVGAERLRKTSRPLDAGPIIATCESLRKALQVGRQVRVAVCERVATPLLVGIVRPLILLPPAALTGWSPAELEMVLLHELAHVRRWDNLVNLAQRVVESLLFFHPAVWIASRWVRHDREDCCDAVVVAFTAKPQAYAELLLALASHGGLATSVAMSQHPVAHRIRRILNLEDEPMLVSRKTLVAVATGFLSLVLTIVLISPHSTDAEEPGVRAPETKASRERQRPEEEEVATEDNESTKEKSKLQEFSFSKTTQIEEIQSFVEFLKSKQGLEVSIRKNKDGTISVLGKALIEPTAHQVHFPSIEEQRAADVAYKLLHLELEKLSEEDLKRVQAMGYQGGMRIDSTYQVGSLNTGDLLVGLHVWPTESLNQVNEILNRDDIDQLSPLKFYVIRKKMVDNSKIGSLPLGPDQLVTGRVPVDLTEWKRLRSAIAKNTYSPHLIQTLHQQHRLDQQRLQNEIAKVQSQLQEANNQNKRSALEERVAALQAELARLAERQEAMKQQDHWKEPPALPQQPPQPPDVPIPPEDKSKESSEKGSALLYDGKTFDQWKRILMTELNEENRIECIKALAAFGASGMGKEAAMVIFDLADQYDFTETQSGKVVKLQNAIYSALTGSVDVGRTIPAEFWLDLLIQRLASNPDQWNRFAQIVLRDVKTQDPATKTKLRSLAKDENYAPKLRAAAVSSLIRTKNQLDDEQIQLLIFDALSAQEPELTSAILWHNLDQLLISNHLIEVQKLLFSGDREMREEVLKALNRMKYPQSAVRLLKPLLTLLDDPQQSADHLTALAAIFEISELIMLRPEAQAQAKESLFKILLEGDPDKLPAVIRTINRITNGTAQTEVLQRLMEINPDGAAGANADVEEARAYRFPHELKVERFASPQAIQNRSPDKKPAKARISPPWVTRKIEKVVQRVGLRTAEILLRTIGTRSHFGLGSTLEDDNTSSSADDIG
ncbi:M56 family metallopeptidase [Bythopirellula goksoeyrii]|uniref:Regulatory protein BlaR1 n=1 Tax=Bythopirellula goksoeyrii TaxID=1400387 RepID=A0A5B9QK51_9BACT|nr:M56 family metallopeptidase [Bythopirellula goksoeyrii]QEG37905.1 Regulatory protein BlaR1 [Bythopirellula goksoeyrii]